MAAKTGESLPRKDKDFLKAMPLNEKREWAKRIVVRLMLAWDVKEMQDLSKFIGGHLRMPSNWITKGVIPWEVIYTCHLQTGRSLDWLYNGNQCAITSTPELKAEYREKVTTLVKALARTKIFLTDNGVKEQEVIDLITSEAMEFFTEIQKPIPNVTESNQSSSDNL